MNPPQETGIDEILNDYATPHYASGAGKLSHEEAKQALLQLFEKEAVGVFFADDKHFTEIYKAVPLSKLRELLGGAV